MNVCIGVIENCKNPESYGTICVKCNMCGRFNKQTNADKIRALNDIDLAISRVVALRAGFYYAVDCGIYKSFQSAVQAEFDWLKQEAI